MRVRLGRVALVVGVALVLFAGLHMGARYLGWVSPRDSVAERSALLSPYYQIRLPPDATGPLPTALLFSGCDGVRDNMGRWADMLNAEGWTAVIVDSHSPRGFDDFQIWRLLCAGQLLTGQERSGDAAVALHDVRRMPFADPDRLLLLGASHGGWAVLDLLAQHATGRRPHGLRTWPDGDPDAALHGVRGAFVLYPYCGLGSGVARSGWQLDVPVAMVLVQDDQITDEAPCLDLAERMAASGLPVTVTLLPGVTHGFDQQERSVLSPLEFNAEATDRALQLGRTFVHGF